MRHKSQLILTSLFALFATAAFAQTGQNPDPAKWMCRNIADSAGFVYDGETIFGSKACRPIPQTPTPSPQSQAQVAPAAVKDSAPAATPAPAQPAVAATPPNGDQAQAAIYFYRPRRFQGSALKPSVFVDDARVGNLHNGDSIKVPIAPGSHRIYSTDKSTGVQLDAKPGETYYVRVDIQLGFWKGHGGVTLVDPQEGRYEVGQAAHQGADNIQ